MQIKDITISLKKGESIRVVSEESPFTIDVSSNNCISLCKHTARLTIEAVHDGEYGIKLRVLDNHA
jgi:hypothetical protein